MLVLPETGGIPHLEVTELLLGILLMTRALQIEHMFFVDSFQIIHTQSIIIDSQKLKTPHSQITLTLRLLLDGTGRKYMVLHSPIIR